MQEILAQLETHVRVAWRYRWFGLAAAMLICLVGWTYVLLMPNVYSSSTRVYLDTSTLLRPALRGLALDAGSQLGAVEMVKRTLLSRPNLETVARNTDMDLQAKTPKEFDALLANLAKDVTITQPRREPVFTISYSNQNPQLSTRVVEAVLNILVERSLGESRKDTTATRDFLEQQIREYEGRLLQAEARLTKFKQENMGLLPRDGGSYFSRLQAQKAQVEEARLQLQEAQNRREQLAAQMGDVDEWFSADEAPSYVAPVSHPLDGRIARLETSLDEMRLRYTDRHPDVIATAGMLEELRSQRESDLRAAKPAAGSGLSRGRVENPLYQQLKMGLGSAEAEVSALQARVDEYQRREAELARLVDASLQVENEMARLNRDYDTDKRNYDELVKRREQLNLADEASKSVEAVKFNIVEPPRVPTAPSSPKRQLLNAVVLVVGLGVGGGLAWLIGMLRPAIYSRETFMQFTELPVIGLVSRISTKAELRQHNLRIALFAAGCVTLVAIFGATVALEPQVMSLVGKLRELGVQIT